MSKITSYLFIPMAIALLASCHQKKILDDVEAILEINPTEADSILNSISKPLSSRNQAVYAILKTQAEYKQYKPFVSDSLILIATNYFNTKKKAYHAALAWYSLGCVYSDMQKDLEAINAFIRAKELFPDTLVRYYALTEQFLGKHYLNQMMLKESQYNLQCCLKNATRLHEDVLTSNILYMLALNTLYQADYPKADTLFNNLLNNPRTSSLRNRQCYLNLAKINLYGYQDYAKAMYNINRYLLELKDPSELGVGYSVKADIYFETERYDSAYLYYIKSMECQAELYTVCDNSGKLAIISIINGNHTAALEYLQLHDELVDSIYDMRKDIAIEEIVRKHQIALKENEIHFRHKRFKIIGVSLFLLFVLCYLLWITRRWNQIAKQQINKQDSARTNSIEIMKAHILDIPFNDKHIARETIINLYKKKLEVCKDAFRETPAFSTLSSKLINSDFSFDTNQKTDIINQISESFIDSILDMNIEITSLNREDIVICILSSLNFNNRFISSFINLSESGVRKRKLRLLEKANKDYIELFF